MLARTQSKNPRKPINEVSAFFFCSLECITMTITPKGGSQKGGGRKRAVVWIVFACSFETKSTRVFDRQINFIAVVEERPFATRRHIISHEKPVSSP